MSSCCSCPPATDSTMLLRLANAPDACGQSRAAITEHLRACECDDDEIYLASLVASELVSNALRHAAPALCLQVDAAADRVRVEVHDAGTTAPTMQQPADDSGGGRGLWLVDRLSIEWGHRPHEVGKVVWADVSRNPP